MVLASTAIQLLDDRKSPIVAGNKPLKHFSNHYFIDITFVCDAVSYMFGLVLSCRDPDEARVLSEEVLDGLQTGN